MHVSSNCLWAFTAAASLSGVSAQRVVKNRSLRTRRLSTHSKSDHVAPANVDVPDKFITNKLKTKHDEQSLMGTRKLPSNVFDRQSAAAEANRAGREVALNHIQSHAPALGLKADDVANVRVTDEVYTAHNGVSSIYIRQTYRGRDVANANINVNVNNGKAIGKVGNSFVKDLAGKGPPTRNSIDSAAAIAAACKDVALEAEVEDLDESHVQRRRLQHRYLQEACSLDDIPSELVYYSLDGQVHLAWQLVIRTNNQKHWYNIWVDANNDEGVVLAKSDWMANDNYEVFAVPKESPSDGARTNEVDPVDPAMFPNKWHKINDSTSYTDTRGNNVWAQEDRDANNSGGYRPDGGAALNFTSTLDLANQRPVDYQDAAIDNLFYYNNIMHDILYNYGFDEAAGNFQENNFGKGGSGGDAVNADAQDGSGTNNANMATPPDGSNPRMQMFEWTPSADASLVVNTPASIAGNYLAVSAGFGGALTTTGITGDIELVNDGTATGSEGCNALVGFTAGSIAMIDRGTCEFGTKVLNAENAGATAAIVVNNQGDGIIVMGAGAQGNQVSISSVMIGQSDGDTIKAELVNVVGATSKKNSAGAIPNRDSDFDNGIIAHEYCHGLSLRLTGGPSTTNCLSGSQQAGEGWSDLCAIFFSATDTDTNVTPRGVGTYVIFEGPEGNGIRPAPYTTDMTVNPFTYGELAANTLSVPHGVGFVWATAVWEVYWKLVEKHGFDPNLYTGTGGNNIAIQLVVDGLKLQPCNPTFLDARDAILLADSQNNGGANECEIWQGFAKRGMGASASDGGSANSLSVTEAFDLPSQCDAPFCGNGICDPLEDCGSCPGDCLRTGSATCGNGICEAADGEDCITCSEDCAGRQSGRPADKYCCGSGGGTNPVSCSDSRCTSGGFTCTNNPAPATDYCCGDGSCEGEEDTANCERDCPAPVCGNGLIEGDEICEPSNLGGETCATLGFASGTLACNGNCDGFDTTGCSGSSCTLLTESCIEDIDCCSGNCSNGPKASRVCQ